ncbi:MAG: hypothetical protein RL487_1172 [Actinomycetota bacterium]|jgi:protein phosphatase
MTRTITFVHGAATHTGQLRRVNQDAFGMGDGVFVVADGLGGHNAGEVASALAVEAVLAGTADGVESPEQFGNAVGAANRAVFDASQQDTGLHGMGTTVTALVALPGPGGRVAVANVGDSRTSLYRAGDFIRVTKDHSRVQEMIDAGEISPDDEWGHPYGNVLTRAVGLEPHVEVDVYVITAEPRDRFLLCSDGLIDEVREEDIAEALWRHRDPQECADRLVDMANEAGGHDNITVIVVDVLAGDAA